MPKGKRRNTHKNTECSGLATTDPVNLERPVITFNARPSASSKCQHLSFVMCFAVLSTFEHTVSGFKFRLTGK